MKADDFLRNSHPLELDICWTDIAGSVEDKVRFFETYVSIRVPLLESNNENMLSYFLNLPSNEPKDDSSAIVALLVLIDNKVRIAQPVGRYYILKVQPENLLIKLPDGNVTEFPSQKILNKMIMRPFVFYNNSTYDKFRSLVKLKFDQDLPNLNQIKETTSAGSVAAIASPLGATITRNASIYGHEPRKKKKGSKTGKYKNSVK